MLKTLKHLHIIIDPNEAKLVKSRGGIKRCYPSTFIDIQAVNVKVLLFLFDHYLNMCLRKSIMIFLLLLPILAGYMTYSYSVAAAMSSLTCLRCITAACHKYMVTQST